MSGDERSPSGSRPGLPSPERWAVLEPLLDRLLDEPVVSRDNLFDEICGSDARLRAELRAILDGEPNMGRVLNRPAFERFASLLEGAESGQGLQPDARQDEIESSADRLDEDLALALQGRYKVERTIGAGGMATVYLARDLRHDRSVAVKVLRPEISILLGAERFLTEIRTTASLQHPHILGLIDSGEAAGRVFYVMPYVRGESLRDKLRREKQLPIGDAVRIAREVALALDYAHRQGVIHRDIKPENILLQDGQAMVADFGIAIAAAAPDTDRRTRTGILLGTPQYMSPEQLAGERQLTPRSDIYALGCVLYEMLTGQAPWDAQRAQSFSARLDAREPPSVTALRSNAPAHVAVAVHTALQKLPADRFVTAQAFADALASSQPLGALPFNAAVRRPLHRSWKAWTAGVALMVAGSVAGWSLRGTGGSRDDGPRVSHLSMLLPAGTHFTELSRGVALSPDGGTIAYAGLDEAGTPHLFVKAMDATEAHHMPETVNASYPFFSPDGRWVGFFAENALKKVALDDGVVVVIARLGADHTGSEAFWGEDGRILFGEANFQRGVGIRRVSERGGPVEVITRPDTSRAEVSHTSPMIVRGTSTLIYTAWRGSLERFTSQIVALPQGAGAPRVLIDGGKLARSARDGQLLYQLGDDVFAADFDARTLELSGETRVLDGVFESGSGASYSAATAASPWAAARDLLAYRQAVTGGRALVWVRRDGKREPLAAPHKAYLNPILSPQGDRLAVLVENGDSMDVWVDDLQYDVLRKLPGDGLTIGFTVWTPDGKRLTTSHRAQMGLDLFTVPADGSCCPERLFGNGSALWPAAWTRDQRALVIMHGGDLDVLDLANGRTVNPMLHTAATEFGGRLSPDERWLAYHSNVSGEWQLYVTSFPDGTSRWQVSREGAREAVWSRDGTELFFRNGRQMLAATVKPGPTFAWDPPRVLFEGDYFQRGGPGYQHYDVAVDGQRFLMIEESPPGSPRIEILQGWSRLASQPAGGAR